MQQRNKMDGEWGRKGGNEEGDREERKIGDTKEERVREHSR